MEMRFLRGATLAIIVALGLIAGVATTAYADDGASGVAPAVTSGPDGGGSDSEPNDPGLPPG